jgi:cobalt/nickel transport system permease protein
MAAILFGPAVTAVLGVIVLLYQALFLAHGGLTTLGANVASMGIIGPVVAYLIYKAGMKANINFYVVVFLAATFADWITYVVTSTQLALAFPSQAGGFVGSLQAFLAIFATTQVPLAIMEGALTALIFKYIIQVKSDALVELKVISQETVNKIKGISA